jgi:hypothetical protein
LCSTPPEFDGSTDIEAYTKDKLAPQLKATTESAQKAFEAARKAINIIHREERSESNDGGDNRSKFVRLRAAHVIALSALKRGQTKTDFILKILTASTEWYKDFKEWRKLEKEVREISTNIRELLRPAKQFLSSVLDRELAAAAGGSYGEWDVVEMACAAAAYGAVTKEWGDDRLRCVVDCLKKVVSERGRFPVGRPFDVDKQIGTSQPYNTVVIEALAQILKESAADALRLKQPIAIPVEPALVRKILRFFNDTRADKPVHRENYGWRFDYMPPPYLTEPCVTAGAVQSLTLINRMLDEQINARVLYHFSVKQREDLEKGPDLDTFFYPDYGLRQGSKSIGRNDSIAILLQKMRAHVAGLQNSDKLFSLVLYGPQGTGKTTIAEALATSCQVPLVEVTPSDLLVWGGEAVERWARIIFEALSLLTRVVILFDEFDPVLWSRDVGDRRSAPSSIFGFLTASMLPKLKTLHKTAEKRSVVYVLITNLIDSLDEATVRQGRFNKKLGIYPPDVLSRAGRFLSEAAVFMEKVKEKDPSTVLPAVAVDELEARLTHILEISCGAGMEGLNQEGWFRRPNNKEPPDDAPLHYYIWGGMKNQKT